MIEISIYSDSRKIYDSSIKKSKSKKLYSIAPLCLAMLDIDILRNFGKIQPNFGIFKYLTPGINSNMFLTFIFLIITIAVCNTVVISKNKNVENNLQSTLKTVFYVILALIPGLILIL